MRVIMIIAIVFAFVTPAFSQWGKDAWGHRTKQENYWEDRDGDGVPNYYDRRDDSRYIW